MRILLDARVTAPDGIGRYTRNLARRLAREAARRSDTLTLLTRGDGPRGIAAPRLQDASRHYTVEELRAVADAAREVDAEVIHCTDYRAPLPRACVPLVVSIHDIFRVTHPALCYDDEQFAQRYGGSASGRLAEVTARLGEAVGAKPLAARPLHELYCRHMVRWASATADTILVPTEEVRRQLLELFPPDCPVVVVPHGVNHEEECEAEGATRDVREAVDDGTPFFLYVGQTRAHKNVALLLRVFRELAADEEAVQLVLAGKSFEEDAEVRALVERLGLGGRVRVVGYVDDKRLAGLYARARAHVHLSAHEGFGLTPLEALARGTPVIVADTRVARETLGAHATFVNTDDVESIVAALRAHASGDVGRAARAEWAARFSWERTARLTREAYEQAAEVFRERRGETFAREGIVTPC